MATVKNAHRRHLSKWIKRGLLAMVALLGLGMIFNGLLPKPVPVDIAQVVRGAMTVTVDEDGHARVKDRYVVGAPISGHLARIELEPGDTVKRGEILARIIPLAPPLLDKRARTTAEARVQAALAAKKRSAAQIAAAEASLAFAKAEAHRYERLGKERVVSQQRLEQARTNRRTAASQVDSARFAKEMAEHELKMARAALGNLKGGSSWLEQLEVPSPLDGRVLRTHQESEGAVQAGTPLLELGDSGAIEIVVDVLTQDAVEMAPGARVSIDRWGGPELEGRVRRVNPSAFTRMSALGVEEQRVLVIVDLVGDPQDWSGLGDGFRVEAHIAVWHQSDALTVSASSVFRSDRGWAVFKAEDGRARLTPVALGRRTGRRVQILSGLAAEDEVVVHPSDRIADQVAVAAREDSP